MRKNAKRGMALVVAVAKRRFGAVTLALVAAAVMCFGGVISTPAHAEKYHYTVTIWPGEQGTLNGSEDPVVIEGLDYGDTLDFNMTQVTVHHGDGTVETKALSVVPKEKYQFRGFVESGKDYTDRDYVYRYELPGNVKVTKDADYVVSYGVPGNAVTVTINYVDANGNPLEGLSSDTYYGSLNDKPIFSYRYLEGYQPDAYNKTLTLKEDNMTVTFVYTPVTAAQQSGAAGTTTTTTTANAGTGSTNTTTGTAAGTASGNTAGGATGTTAGGAAAGDVGDTGAGGAGNEATGDAAADGGADTGAGEPAEIVDLDEGNVPLAGTDSGQADIDEDGNEAGIGADEAADAGMSTAAKVGIGVVIAAAVAALIGIVTVRASKRKDEEL